MLRGGFARIGSLSDGLGLLFDSVTECLDARVVVIGAEVLYLIPALIHYLRQLYLLHLRHGTILLKWGYPRIFIYRLAIY